MAWKPDLRYHTDEDIQTINETWIQVYHKERTDEHWLWRFNRNPYGMGVMTLAEDRGRLIGMYSNNPMLVSVDGEQVLGAFCLDLFTIEQYRGKGLFLHMVRDVQRNWTEKGAAFLFGFPNELAIGGYEKLGWTTMGNVQQWEMELGQDTRVETIQDISEVESFDVGVDRLWESVGKELGVSVVRRSDYLNWRYAENPSVDYPLLVHGGGDDITGYAVLKIYESTLGRFGHIVDIVAETEAIFHELVRYTMGYYYAMGVERLTMWYPEWHPHAKVLRDEGFNIETMPRTYFAVKPLGGSDDIISRATDRDRWFLTMGDSDVF